MTPSNWGLAENGLFVHGITIDEHGCFSSIEKRGFSHGFSCGFDGHVHTTASDGFRTPGELALEALRLGVQVVVADHDTVSGAVEAMASIEELMRHDSSSSAKIIPGIELSVCVDAGGLAPLKSLHLLGVGVDVKDASLLSCAENSSSSRAHEIKNARRLVAMMEEEGFMFDQRVHSRIEMQGDAVRSIVKSINMRHNLRPLRRMGVRADGGLLRPMKRKKRMRFERDVRESIKRVYGSFASWRSNLADAVEAIKSAGGIAVIPHILSSHHELETMPLNQLRVIFSRLKDVGVDGIEVYHPSHDLFGIRRLSSAATSTGLIIAGGSDAHYRSQDLGLFQRRYSNC